MEHTMYCKFEGDQVTLFLKKEPNTNKCKIYLDAIQQFSRKTYEEVLLILDYINQGEDVWYWKEIFDLKKQEFMRLINYRKQILEMISRFEEKFLAQYQQSLKSGLEPYLQDLYFLHLQVSQENALDPQQLKKSLLLQHIEQQIFIIESVFQATSLQIIMDAIPNYLYLKQQIE
ncbi:MAG: hypothetical protein LBI53_03315 [Candidatus Peribacteria bacterium]|nr:hypothetical protein [Candidatus Peribacteria bacterium]